MNRPNISIRIKLIGVLSLAGSVAAAMMLSLMIEKRAESNLLSTISEATVFLGYTNAIVHESQKERGASGVFLGSNGTNFATELSRQRDLTDERIESFEAHLSEFDPASVSANFHQQLRTAQSHMERLSQIRSQVDAQSISRAEALAYYTGMNANFLSLIDEFRRIIEDGITSAKVGALSAFLQAKERAGIERAVLSVTFSANSFPEGFYEHFVTLLAEQQAYLSVFENLAPEEYVDLYESTMNSDAVRQVDDMRQIARENAATGRFGVDGSHWFATITTKINLLKDVENHLTEELTTSATAEGDRAGGVALLSIGFMILLGGALCAGFILVFSVVKAIKELSETLEDISEGEGDVTARIEVKGNDEIGEVSRYFNAFAEKIQNAMIEVTDCSSSLASTTESLSTSAGEMATSATEMSSQSTDAAAAVEQLSSNLTQIAASAEDSTSMVVTVATAIEEMSSSFSEVAKNCTDGSRMSSDADNRAAAAGETMNSLNTSAEEIGKVIGTISDIADQTNLLALNATIEAASAGDAGKGFAVVANEVKELAKQTAQATEEIKRLIGEMQGRTRDAVGATNDISNIIGQLNGVVQIIASAVEEQSAAANEIAESVGRSSASAEGLSRNIQEASVGSAEVSKTVQWVNRASDTVRSGADQTNAGSGELATLASRLSRLVGQFKIEDETLSGDRAPGP